MPTNHTSSKSFWEALEEKKLAAQAKRNFEFQQKMNSFKPKKSPGKKPAKRRKRTSLFGSIIKYFTK